MAQAFLTTNNITYRCPEIDRRKSLRPTDKFAERLPHGDIWLVIKQLDESDEGDEGGALAQANTDIKRMYRKRLWTTYQMDYCKDQIQKESAAAETAGKSFENELLESCKKLYSQKTQKIFPPLPSTRRLFGYIRPVRMYVPLTTYQTEHSKIGYKILNGDFSKKKKKETTNISSSKALVLKETKENAKVINQSNIKKSKCTCCPCK